MLNSSEYLQSSFGFGVISVLVNDAFGFFQIMFFGCFLPPIHQISIEIKLSTLNIIKLIRTINENGLRACTQFFPCVDGEIFIFLCTADALIHLLYFFFLIICSVPNKNEFLTKIPKTIYS